MKKTHKLFSQRRRLFTLIELLVVMALMGVIAAAVGINIQKMLQEQRFRTQTRILLDKLQTAQQMLLVLGSDVKVELNTKETGLEVIVDIESNITTALADIFKKNQNLSGIRSFSFEQEETTTKNEPTTLHFYFTTKQIPLGTLLVSAYNDPSDEGPLKRYISFAGYPSPLTLTAYPPEEDTEEEYFNESDELYPEQVRENRLP